MTYQSDFWGMNLLYPFYWALVVTGKVMHCWKKIKNSYLYFFNSALGKKVYKTKIFSKHLFSRCAKFKTIRSVFSDTGVIIKLYIFVSIWLVVAGGRQRSSSDYTNSVPKQTPPIMVMIYHRKIFWIIPIRIYNFIPFWGFLPFFPTF